MKNINNILNNLRVEKIEPLSKQELTELKTTVFSEINKSKKVKIFKLFLWSVSTAAVFAIILFIQQFVIKSKTDFSTIDKNEIKKYLLEEDNDSFFDEIKIFYDKENHDEIIEFIEDEDIENFIINN